MYRHNHSSGSVVMLKGAVLCARPRRVCGEPDFVDRIDRAGAGDCSVASARYGGRLRRMLAAHERVLRRRSPGITLALPGGVSASAPS